MPATAVQNSRPTFSRRHKSNKLLNDCEVSIGYVLRSSSLYRLFRRQVSPCVPASARSSELLPLASMWLRPLSIDGHPFSRHTGQSQLSCASHPRSVYESCLFTLPRFIDGLRPRRRARCGAFAPRDRELCPSYFGSCRHFAE